MNSSTISGIIGIIYSSLELFNNVRFDNISENKKFIYLIDNYKKPYLNYNDSERLLGYYAQAVYYHIYYIVKDISARVQSDKNLYFFISTVLDMIAQLISENKKRKEGDNIKKMKMEYNEFEILDKILYGMFKISEGDFILNICSWIRHNNNGKDYEPEFKEILLKALLLDCSVISEQKDKEAIIDFALSCKNIVNKKSVLLTISEVLKYDENLNELVDDRIFKIYEDNYYKESKVGMSFLMVNMDFVKEIITQRNYDILQDSIYYPNSYEKVLFIIIYHYDK